MKNTKKNNGSYVIFAIVLFTAFQISGAAKSTQDKSISMLNEKVNKLTGEITNLTNTVKNLQADVANLSKKTPEQKKSPQPPIQKPTATQPVSSKQTSKTSPLLSKPVSFVKKSTPMSITPGIESAQEFINIMVSHSKKNELESDLFSNNPSNKTVAFLGLELRKVYPSISLDNAANMIHDAIAEQIFNKKTSAEFMSFVKNAIKGYWDMSNKSPMLNLQQGTNLTSEEQENLSGPL